MRPKNLEVFQSEYIECKHCGTVDLNCEGQCDRTCGQRDWSPKMTGWFYWFCLPGCLPDSDAMGPFKTEAEAEQNATDTFGDDPENGADL
jgi:hypothetical protein